MHNTIDTKDVQIIVLDDIVFDKSVLPRDEGSYHFVWHSPTVDYRIKDHQHVQRFIDFLSGHPDSKWGPLPALAIMVLDLRYDTRLPPKEDTELTEWLGEHDKRFNPSQRPGLYVLGKVLKNQAFHGLIAVATSVGSNIVIDTIAERVLPGRFSCPNIEVVSKDFRGALADNGNAGNIIDVAIRRFLRRFGSLTKRFWPDHTANWFSKEWEEVTHDSPTPGSDSWTKTETAIRKYLESLLGFPPPEAWFNTEQLPSLWEDLHGLVGSSSISQGKGIRNLTLGNLVLILAVACKESARNWIETISWDKRKEGLEFLPTQTLHQARKVVYALAGGGPTEDEGLFPQLVWDEKDSSCNFVHKVILAPSRLSIILAHDFSVPTKTHRPPLLEKVAYYTGVDGHTYLAFRQFRVAVADDPSVQGHRASCAVNFYLNKEQNTVLEIVRCLP